jgi:hypothetical protein
MPDGDRLTARLCLVSVVVALLPIGVAAGRALHQGWIPVSENALYAIRARDVFTHHIPLLGTLAGAAGSRLSNQPGPLLFDLLAIPVTLLGDGAGVIVGVSLINALSVVGIALLAYRRGGALVATAAMAATSGLCWTMGSTMLFEPWNPHSVLLPFLCFLLLVWSVTCGDVWALPFLVAAGSLVVQTHLSYGLLVPLLSAWAVFGLVLELRARRRIDSQRSSLLRSTRRAFAVSALVLLLCWTQPLIEQFTGDGTGNLTRLLTNAGSSAPTGYAEGTKLVAEVVGLPPWWLRPSFGRAFLESKGWRAPSIEAALASLAFVGAALAWCAWDARRRHDTPLGRAVATTFIALGVGLLTAGRAPLGPVAFLRISPHLFRWLWPLAVFLTFTFATTLLLRFARDARATRLLVGGSSLVTMAFAGLNLPTSTAGTSQDNAVIPAVRELTGRISRADLEGPLLADDLYQLGFGDAWGPPVLAAIQRRGISFVLRDEGLVRQFGPTRRFDGNNARGALLIRVGDDAAMTPSGARPVVRRDGITAAERRELAMLERQIAEHVRTRGLRLNRDGQRALARGDLPGLRTQQVAPDPNALLRTRVLAHLIREHFLVVDLTWNARYRRYADLIGRADTTVVLFVRPLMPR